MNVQLGFSSASFAVVVGDVNGDNRPDLVVGNEERDGVTTLPQDC